MPKSQTIGDFFERVYVVEKLIGAAPNTVKEYRTQISLLNQWAQNEGEKGDLAPNGELRLSSLSDSLLARAMQWRLSQGAAAPTVNKLYRHITPIWKLAWRKRLLDDLCRLEPIREPRYIARTWTPGQFGRILARTQWLPESVSPVRFPEGVCGIASAKWWYAILLFDYYTGLRLNALMQVRYQDVDLRSRGVLVRASTQKQKSDQFFELTDDLVEALEAIRKPSRRFLFPWHLDRYRETGEYNGHWKALTRCLRLILKAEGLPSGRKDLWHCIRRLTCTMIAANAGLDVAQRHLGHSANRVTRRYVDPNQARDRIRPADVLPRPVPPRPPKHTKGDAE